MPPELCSDRVPSCRPHVQNTIPDKRGASSITVVPEELYRLLAKPNDEVVIPCNRYPFIRESGSRYKVGGRVAGYAVKVRVVDSPGGGHVKNKTVHVSGEADYISREIGGDLRPSATLWIDPSLQGSRGAVVEVPYKVRSPAYIRFS